MAQAGGRRLNTHGAIDLETGNTRMLEVATANADSTIKLPMALRALCSRKRVIHLFPDNARHHHAKRARAWLAQPGRRIKPHFIPAYCPRLDPIERLWGLMRKHITHNRCHETLAACREAILTILREDAPRNWHHYCNAVTDNFRIIAPEDFRILTRTRHTSAIVVPYSFSFIVLQSKDQLHSMVNSRSQFVSSLW